MIWWENTVRNALWDSYENNEIRVLSFLRLWWKHTNSRKNQTFSDFWIAPSVVKTSFTLIQQSRFRIQNRATCLPFERHPPIYHSSAYPDTSSSATLTLKTCEFPSSDRLFLFLNYENHFYEIMKSRSWCWWGWC